MGRDVHRILTAAALAWPGLAHAGAWTLPQGDILTISTADWTTASRAFGDDADVFFEKVETRLYGEAGLTEALTLTGATSFQDVIYDGRDGKSRYVGSGDARAGARLSLWRPGRHRFAASGDIGYQRGGEFVADGELNLEGVSSEWRGLYGYGWDRAYLDVQAGWTTRFDSGPDSFSFDVTTGVELASRLKLNLAAFARTTRPARLADEVIGRTDSLKLRAGLLWQPPSKPRAGEDGEPLRPLHRTGYEIGWVQTVSGTNHVADGGLSVGVWKRF